MKEDKFILICAVCLVIFCKFWGLFTSPLFNIELTNDITVTEVTDKTISSDKSVKTADTEVKVNSDNANAEKETIVQQSADVKNSDTEQKTAVADKKSEDQTKNFIGCGSSFSSEKTTNRVNGETQKQYSARNIITCDCNMDGVIVEKTVMYRYSAEPKKVDLDCNSKCGAICAQD